MNISTAVFLLIVIDAVLVFAAFGYLIISQKRIRDLHKECEKTLDQGVEEEKDYVAHIALRQMQMIEKFNDLVLAQAQKSFTFAVIYSLAGILFFVTFMFVRQPQDPPTISAIGSIVLELISGANLYLYGRAAHQMEVCHARLFKVQNFLLSISVCKGFVNEKREETCAKIALIIANYSENTNGKFQEGKIDERAEGPGTNGSHPQVERNQLSV